MQRFLLYLLSWCLLIAPIRGQQPAASTSPPQNPPRTDETDVVRITTNLVQVDAVVTKDGKQVTDLKAEDFELFEDGRPQPITNFSYISNMLSEPAKASNTAPAKDKTTPVVPSVPRPYEVRRTIAFVIDDLGMSYESIVHARQQLRKLIDQNLEANDLVAIVRTGGEVGALQQFTTDRRMLYDALERLRWHPCSRTGLNIFVPEGSDRVRFDAPCGGGQNIRDTLNSLKFVVQGMRDLPGRKSVVLFSDYLPAETQEPTSNMPDEIVSIDRNDFRAQLRKAAEMAIRASVVIYSVDTRGLAYTGPTMTDRISGNQGAMTDQMNNVLTRRGVAMNRGREGSEMIARQTGGFLIRNSNDFGLTKIADDQKGYYLLGYRPTDQTFNRQFHHLKLKVKGHGLTVRTREGFYGVSEEEARAGDLTPSDQLKRALISPFGANDVRLRLTALFTSFPEGSMLRSLLYINAQDLTFVDGPSGEHKTTFDLGMVLFGDNGSVRDQQNRLVNLTLRDKLYQDALRNGIVYTLDTPVKVTGGFQFRIALRDQNSSRLGSAGQYVQLPNLQSGRLTLSGLVMLRDDQPGPTAPQSDNIVSAGPAVRQYEIGAKILFAYSIYNSKLDPAKQLPQLTTQTRIFRDGKLIFTGEPMPIEVAAGSDSKRLANITRFQLRPDFSPGYYVLQVIVTDQLADEKQRIASQWMDFEVVR